MIAVWAANPGKTILHGPTVEVFANASPVNAIIPAFPEALKTITRFRFNFETAAGPNASLLNLMKTHLS
jgi:hypothetical protein